jgi:hypothetical protein
MCVKAGSASLMGVMMIDDRGFEHMLTPTFVESIFRIFVGRKNTRIYQLLTRFVSLSFLQSWRHDVNWTLHCVLCLDPWVDWHLCVSFCFHWYYVERF